MGHSEDNFVTDSVKAYFLFDAKIDSSHLVQGGPCGRGIDYVDIELRVAF